MTTQGLPAAGRKYFLALHIGAGYHAADKAPEYHRIIEKALNEGQRCLMEGRSATEALCQAISVLEGEESTNAGYGSNLTEEGTVECDARYSLCKERGGEACRRSEETKEQRRHEMGRAEKGSAGPAVLILLSIMEGDTGAFGAVGALSGVQHPIDVAHKLLLEQNRGLLPLGRIPPMFLAGPGAARWAARHGVAVHGSCDHLVSPAARRAWLKYKHLLETPAAAAHKRRKEEKEQQQSVGEQEEKDEGRSRRYDTVGGICLDRHGSVAAAVSSGGIAMKAEGRVGAAAVYGAGCWAQRGRAEAAAGVTPCVAVSTSGVGEQIMYSSLASEAARALLQEDHDEALHCLLQGHVLHHGHPLSSLPPVIPYERCVGLVALKLSQAEAGDGPGAKDQRRDGEAPLLEFVWSHSTESLGVGYAVEGEAPKSFISRMEPAQAGRSVKIGGMQWRI